MKTQPEGRLSVAHLAILIVTVAYFISSLMGYSTFLTVLAFPAIYIVPGLVLLLLASRNQNHDFRQLIVLSFFLSTIMAVVLVSILILFGITVQVSSISTIYLALTLASVFLMAILGKTNQLRASHLDYAFLSISLIVYTCLAYLFTSMPRLFTMDETTYIAWSRYAILKGEIYPIGLPPSKFDLVYLVGGRFFWTLLVTSFLGSTGLPAYQAHTINSMFLPMIAIASTLLIPSKFRGNKLLEAGIFALILFNPVLLLFSDFVLNDLAVGFYLLLSILLFIKSFNRSDQGKVSISVRGLLISFLMLMVASLIKENMIIAFAMYVILVFCVLKYGLYKVSKVWTALLYALILPPIVYEALIDMPYVVSLYFVKNATIASLTSKFLIISPAELFLGIFIPTAFEPTTIFSYDLYGYLHYLYRMLSPETLGLLVASVGIALPLALKLEKLRKDIQARILIYSATVTLWLIYTLFLSFNAFWDIPRYSLFMTPIFAVISLASLYEAFYNRNLSFGIALILPMLLLLGIQLALSINKGGVYIGYGLPKLNWTYVILYVQAALYIIILLLLSPHTRERTDKISLKVSSGKGREMVTDVRKIAFIVFVVVILVNEVYFSAYSLNNSSFFMENEASVVNPLFRGVDLNNTFIVSNFYTYVRPYAPDGLLKNGYLFPPPMTEEEFKEFLQMAPNDTMLVIGHDPAIAWYEYGNRYIYRYTSTNFIPVAPKHERIIYDGLLLDLRLGSAYNASENNHILLIKGGTIVDGFFDKAVKFNGENEYASISDFEFPNEYSVEIWFMPEKEPSNFGLMDDGTPIVKMLLAKRYHGYAELMLSVTGEGAIQALAKNENNDIRFNLISPKGLVKADGWYQLVLTVDKQNAKIYLNGMLVGKSSVKGLNQNLKDYPESSKEPLKIGADGSSAYTRYRYFPGRIEDVRIYNRALTDEEVADMYYGVKLLKTIDGVRIFKVESPIQLHVNRNGNTVNITSVEVYSTNATNVRLTIKADAMSDQKIFVMVGTIRFLKVLSTDLKSGQNEISWDFKYILEDRSAYGAYIASMSRIVIYDGNGNLLYDKIHVPFTLSGGYLALWVLILSLFAFLVLVLKRSFHFE